MIVLNKFNHRKNRDQILFEPTGFFIQNWAKKKTKMYPNKLNKTFSQIDLALYGLFHLRLKSCLIYICVSFTCVKQ